jgi:hypothetical protein
MSSDADEKPKLSGAMLILEAIANTIQWCRDFTEVMFSTTKNEYQKKIDWDARKKEHKNVR